MREIKFRGYYTGDNNVPAMWCYGSLIIEKCGGCCIITEDGGYSVDPESVGMMLKDGIYEGDIFTVDQYPFFNEGLNNYVGVVEYVPDDGFCGWYYGLKAISDRVRGCACGSGMADLEGFEITVIGNKYQNPELLESSE